MRGIVWMCVSVSFFFFLTLLTCINILCDTKPITVHDPKPLILISRELSLSHSEHAYGIMCTAYSIHMVHTQTLSCLIFSSRSIRVFAYVKLLCICVLIAVVVIYFMSPFQHVILQQILFFRALALARSLTQLRVRSQSLVLCAYFNYVREAGQKYFAPKNQNIIIKSLAQLKGCAK